MMERKSAALGNGTTISYLERPGGTEPLVLLHGITDSAKTYEPLAGRIDERFRVHALDFRGHGLSDKPDSLYDTDAYADDVRHFIREVIGAPVLLEGHSLGGAVSVQVGATAPELVTGLVLEDPPLYFVNDLNEVYRALFEGIVVMATTLQDGSQSPDDWFEVMANAPDPYSGKPGIETMGEARIRLRLESIGQMKPKALRDAIDGSLQWDTDLVLGNIQSPVTLLWGDPAIGAVMTAAEVESASSILERCRAIQAAEVGHLIHDQAPEVWLDAINGWQV
jgi:pimeloyl-ACP methyl ester carboxylesterase